MAVSRVTLRHTETGAEWDCPAEAVDLWRPQGWRPTTEDAPADDGGGDTESPPTDDEPAEGGDESSEAAASRRSRKGSK